MQTHPFGITDLQVSQLGLGCARIGGIFKQSGSEFIELLHAAQDLGINFFDTADMYSQGESEQLLGQAFRRRRREVIIASKVGYILPRQRRLIARIKPVVRPVIRLLGVKRSLLPAVVRGKPSQSFDPGYIRKAVESSLRRLRTDYLDILQLHSPPADVVRSGDWLSAIERLRRSGKTRYLGISCDTVEAARAALSVPGVACLQLVVNLFERSMADEITVEAQRRGIAVIARECLANGILAKPATEVDLMSYCSTPEQAAQRHAELLSYHDSARQRGLTVSALALEYATAVQGVTVTLVGASRTKQLRDTIESFQALGATKQSA
jgi:aryl-alcohol dehydrogenase-like predicted oxidoreductase